MQSDNSSSVLVLTEDETSNETIFSLAEKYYIHKGDIEDLKEDLLRIKSLKKLITRYNEKGVMKERLICNHITVLFNVFHPAFVRYLLQHSFPATSDWIIINTFLVFLHRSLDLIFVSDEIYTYLKANI